MNHDLEVKASVDIDASGAQVWKALTDPKIIKQYLFGTNCMTDWKVGSSIIFQGNYEGQSYMDKGLVVENIPNEKLSYNYWSGFSGLEDKPENYCLVTYLLKTNGATTTLTWHQKGYGNEEGRKHSEDGMAEFLESIKKIVER